MKRILEALMQGRRSDFEIGGVNTNNFVGEWRAPTRSPSREVRGHAPPENFGENKGKMVQIYYICNYCKTLKFSDDYI